MVISFYAGQFLSRVFGCHEFRSGLASRDVHCFRHCPALQTGKMHVGCRLKLPFFARCMELLAVWPRASQIRTMKPIKRLIKSVSSG